MPEPEILHKTDQWVVVNKPAGWLSIPGRSQAPVLTDYVREKCGDIWVTHRLDVETSGVILFARSEDAHRQANQWFQKHLAKKLYHCLATGNPALPVFKINAPIDDSPSVTQVEVKERFKEAASEVFLGQVRLQTGRRHQIRIHLSSLGYPLLGDVKYSGRKDFAGTPGFQELKVPRVALHASSLELPSGEKFEAPLPEDFQSWLGLLRKSTS
ncbi:MAG: RluA family pseudouridine synthase [Methylotenera sp.]|nr:RluA family pseudouridine synthase [Oligoflexia bacterium]